MRKTAGIGIICKTPRTGTSKTRLHGVLSPSAAAELAGCFLSDVARTISSVSRDLDGQGYAIYAPEGSEPELRAFLPAEFQLICRRDATLGVVLLGATTTLLDAGHDCALLVNADSPTLPPTLLQQALETLRAPGDRLVLGPATDGGYYLIGLKTAHARVFEDIAWSTPAVLATTIERARDIGLPVELLPRWYDVDDAESLDELIRELEDGTVPAGCGGQRSGPAVTTRRFLDRYPDLATRTRAVMTTAARAAR